MEVPWDELNEHQREVCEHLDGPVLVIGGPGSGKTTVIRHRYEQLVKSGVSPENILLTTFSRDAVAELRERISTDTGGGTNIGTIHSIFYKIVKEHYRKLGYQTANLNLYQDDEVEALLREIVTEMTHGNVNKKVLNDTVRFYKVNLQKVRAKGMTPSDLEQAMRDAASSWEGGGAASDSEMRGGFAFQHLIADRTLDTIDGAEGRAPAVYREFLDRLYDRNAIDYTGMQQKAYIVLKNNEDALQEYRDRYQYILVDEAQDLNFVQWQLIRLLGEEHRNVCMVGDDCQNIYSWRGSNHRFLYDFRDTFDATVYTLPVNYRSTQQIVDAVNAFMGHLEGVEQKKLVSDKGRHPVSDGFPKVTEYENTHLERNKVVRAIYDLVENGQDPKEIAILLRTRGRGGGRVEAYKELLNSMRLESSDTRGFRFLDRREVKWVMAYLKAYLNPDDDIVLQSLLLQQDGITSETLDKLFQKKPENKSLRKYVMGLTPLHASLIDPDKLRTIQNTIKFLNTLDDADNMVHHIYVETGLKQRIVDWGGDTDSRRMNIASMREAMAEYPQTRSGVSQFFDYLTNTATEEEAEGITITTMHGAKGKEWDVVFMPELTDKNVPHPMAESINEEKRLFYVALSRARERSYLSYSGEPSEFLDFLT